MNYVSSKRKNPFVVHAIFVKENVMAKLGRNEHNNPTETSKPSHFLESNIDQYLKQTVSSKNPKTTKNKKKSKTLTRPYKQM